MSEQQTPPGVIPYVDVHDGPKRIVTINLDIGRIVLGSSAPMRNRMCPTLGVDGRQYVVYWGDVHFEIPADRQCHVAISLDDSFQAASVLLAPGTGPLRLEYRAQQSGRAILGPVAPG